MLYRLYQPADFRRALRGRGALLSAAHSASAAPGCASSSPSPNSATWIAEENENDGRLRHRRVDHRAQGGPSPTSRRLKCIQIRAGAASPPSYCAALKTPPARPARRSIWLHVDVENRCRHPSLRSHGYARQGREEHYYARHRAAFIYARVPGRCLLSSVRCPRF